MSIDETNNKKIKIKIWFKLVREDTHPLEKIKINTRNEGDSEIFSL